MKFHVGEVIDGFTVIGRINPKLLVQCNNCGKIYEKHYPTSDSKYKCDCMKHPPRPARQYVLITYEGKTQNATEWAKETGLSRETISKRFHAGLPPEAIFVPFRKSERQCQYCGKSFMPNRNDQKYCSRNCAENDRYNEEQRRQYHNFKGSNRIYRNGKPDRDVTLTKLYMRDMGICALCGKHIDFDCDVNSNNYPTIDHIIPISKGGLHKWDNVQLACRGCNMKKSDK